MTFKGVINWGGAVRSRKKISVVYLANPMLLVEVTNKIFDNNIIVVEDHVPEPSWKSLCPS